MGCQPGVSNFFHLKLDFNFTFPNHSSPRLPNFSNGGSRLPRLRLLKQALSCSFSFPGEETPNCQQGLLPLLSKRTRIWLCLYQFHPRLSLCSVPWIVTNSLLSGLPASTLSTPISPWHLISSPLRGQSDALSLKNKSQITPLPYSTSCSGPGSWNKALEVLHYWLPLSSQTSSFYYLLLIQLQPCRPPFSSLHPQDCCHPMVLALVFLMLGGIFPDSQVMNSLTASVLCSNVASSEPASWPLCLKL